VRTIGLVAPRERDLYVVLDNEKIGWDEHSAVLPYEPDED
jgi:hypothetical protein